DGRHVTKESPVAPYRQIVERGDQQPVTPRVRDVATVCSQIEAVGYRRPIDDFRIERRRCVAAYIAKALGPSVTRLQGQPSSQALIQLRLQGFVVHVALIGSGKNPAPVRIRLGV